MLGPVDPLMDFKGATERLSAGRVVALLGEQHAQSVQRVGCLGPVVTEVRLTKRQRPLQVSARLPMVTEVRAYASQSGLEPGSDERLVPQLTFDRLGSAAEDLARSRCGGGRPSGIEAAERAGEQFHLPVRQPFCGPRPHQPDRSHRESRHQRHERENGRRDTSPVTATELTQPVCSTRRTSRDRLAAQVTLDVASQFRRRAIAALSVLLEGLHGDPVEIAAEQLHQLAFVGAPPIRHVLSRVAKPAQAGARRGRILFADHPSHLVEAGCP